MKNTTVRFVQKHEVGLIAQLGDFVKRWSWGEDFPCDATDLLTHAEYICVAMRKVGAHEDPVGVACITRYKGCPDDPENTDLWFCCWVVRDELRGVGIGTLLYTTCIAQAKESKRPEEVYLYASTDNPRATKTLKRRQGWLQWWWWFDRYGVNEDGSPMRVWRLRI